MSLYKGRALAVAAAMASDVAVAHTRALPVIVVVAGAAGAPETGAYKALIEGVRIKTRLTHIFMKNGVFLIRKPD